MNEIEFATVQCMLKYGSRFNKCLAELMLTADGVNFLKLKRDWLHEFDHYKEVNRREDSRDRLGYDMSVAQHRHLARNGVNFEGGHPVNTIARR